MLVYMDTKMIEPNMEPTLYDVIHVMQLGFARIEERFELVDQRFDRLEERMRSVEHRLFKVELRLEDLAGVSHTHEKRIIVLERWKKSSGRAGMAGA